MNIDLLTVHSLRVFESASKQGTLKVSPRGFNSISLRLSGSCRLESGGREYLSRTGDITFVPGEIAYKTSTRQETGIIVAHFIARESLGRDIEIFHGFPEGDEESVFRALLEEWKSFPHENSLGCMSAFYQIMSRLRSLTEAPGRNADLDSAVSRMYERYRCADFEIQELYSGLYISEAYFRRLFKQAYGCSPGIYLRQLRISHAKSLLETGAYTAAEIAELSGFSSAAYFCSAFKQATGQTPTDYARTGVII